MAPIESLRQWNLYFEYRDSYTKKERRIIREQLSKEQQKDDLK